MRVPFDTIFEVNNGLLSNKVAFRMGGMEAFPYALKDYEGCFGGVTLSLLIGRDIEILIDGDFFVIKGIY